MKQNPCENKTSYLASSKFQVSNGIQKAGLMLKKSNKYRCIPKSDL